MPDDDELFEAFWSPMETYRHYRRWWPPLLGYFLTLYVLAGALAVLFAAVL